MKITIDKLRKRCYNISMFTDGLMNFVKFVAAYTFFFVWFAYAITFIGTITLNSAIGVYLLMLASLTLILTLVSLSLSGKIFIFTENY